jgi:glycine cleavage system regulatory protein
VTSSLVLTLIGPDRPGLVEALSRTVADHGANWLESRMAHLSGHFTGMVRVSVPAERAEELAAALRSLEGLRVLVETASAAPVQDAPVVVLELLGQDRPGIVREVSHALAARGVNVEELETECHSAPMSGETLFRARARLRLPPGLAVEALREALEKLADELMVDVALERGE